MLYSDYLAEVERCFGSLSRVDVNNLLVVIQNAIKDNRSIYVCGNGGSFSTSMHFATDLMKGTSERCSWNIRAFALGTNQSLSTAIANDFSYEDLFATELASLGKPGDVLFCISCSGNSSNILKVVEVAKKMEIDVVSLTGFQGGVLKSLSSFNVNINSNIMGVIEDLHLSICHTISFSLEISPYI
jgi:D-sedoheptulose 7-phosphate isomerase